MRMDPLYWMRSKWIDPKSGKLIVGSWIKVQFDYNRLEMAQRAVKRGHIVEWKNRKSENNY